MHASFLEILSDIGINPDHFKTGSLKVSSPINGQVFAHAVTDNTESAQQKIDAATKAFKKWRTVPAPQRGELVRLFANELRTHKAALGALVTLECGKILEEGKGEVQEMIDICDYAVGLSRQLYGLTIASERPGHHMREFWQPLGPVGIISAFNFPVAVWAWNTALALVCGDPCLWKPSEKTPIVALVCQMLLERAIEKFGTDAPDGLSAVLVGGPEVGQIITDSPDIALVSATGSTRMGREVGPRVSKRFGKCLLELGGNNAIIVAPSADLKLAIPGIVFGTIGTAGQRCTSTRRLIVHSDIYDTLIPKLRDAFESASVGNPLETKTLVGPLIDQDAFSAMQRALETAKADGGKVFGGQRLNEAAHADAFYVQPALVEMPSQTEGVCTETFAPILYVMKYENFDDALELQNAVPQGLSSAVFTNDVREAEIFVSTAGSDCGIANVNIGTSGAEIGGAFGGEKETGGGRESGSDAWRAYMRRQTSTVNYSRNLPLAQGIKFDLN
jgi:aldehyde dehydrogenase (NAD+)